MLETPRPLVERTMLEFLPPGLILLAGAVLIVVLAPSADDLAWRFAYAIPATACLIALIFGSGLVRLPPYFIASLRRRLG
mgnify:CR=1 FL=1